MRRLALAALTAATTLALAATAAADHHLMKVNEVATSYGMGGQYVELKDDADEPFPDGSGPYALEVFDGSAVSGGSQALGNPFNDTGFDASQPYLIASDGAGLPARDAQLTVSLPVPSGTVCFTSSIGRVHCVAYGCPAAVPLGAQRGSEPPAGQSLSRAGGSLTIGAATPDAPNAAGAAADCSTPAADTTRPRVTSSARRRQDVDRLAVAVRLNERARLTVSAAVNVPGAARTLRFRTVRRTVNAGVRMRVRLRLARPRLRAVKRSLRRGRRLTARVKLVARDAAGNASTVRRSIRLAN